MRLSEYFKETGVKQRFFAQNMSPPVSDQTMSDWVNMKAVPSLDRLIEVQALTRGKVKPIDWVKPKTTGEVA